LIVLLYVAVILQQTNTIALGDFFGYLLYFIMAVGIVAGIWLLIKPPKKKKE